MCTRVHITTRIRRDTGKKQKEQDLRMVVYLVRSFVFVMHVRACVYQIILYTRKSTCLLTRMRSRPFEVKSFWAGTQGRDPAMVALLSNDDIAMKSMLNAMV